MILRTTAIVGVIALSVLMAAVFPQDRKRNFTLRNQTGVEIHQLFLSPHSSDDWEEDVLGREALPDGERIQINFDDRDKHEMWDLKVVDGKGASIPGRNLISRRFPTLPFTTRAARRGRT